MFERTIKGAREAADAGQIDEWVHAFLSTGLGANPPMAVGLRKQQRWWIGPVAVPITTVDENLWAGSGDGVSHHPRGVGGTRCGHHGR